ncbi:MAG: glycyl radical enzyme [Desulfosporosinus sp. BRH_c37]|nr:MAG: glycyl radical enzyme [Desulfosporosinus sp. BRH_c37]
MPITERTKRLKARCRWKHTSAGEFVDESIHAGIERARYITESHKQTVGEPNVLRRAKGLANILNKMTILIQEDELIVGDHVERPNFVPLYPEISYFVTLDFIKSPYGPAEKEEAMEICKYWEPYTLQRKGESYFTPEELERAYNFCTIEAPAFVTGFNSVVPPYESVLEDGLLKRIDMIQAKIDEAFAELQKDPWNAPERLSLIDKIDNWRAMIIVNKAVIAWARRHGRLARIIAENFEAEPARKKELMEISDICQRMPAEPAKGLRDGMQSKWFTYLVCHGLERYASGYAQKEDKLLYPYYKVSVDEKSFQPMTREEAQELVECERFKVSEHGSCKDRGHREAFPGSNDLFILTVGGKNRDGSDGCNDMTDVILDAAVSTMTPEPSIVFRWHPKGRMETKARVFECVKAGLGFPSIKHEDVNYAQMLKWGATPEQARDWCLVLCMSPGLCGRRATQKVRTEGGGSHFTGKCFEIALYDGFDASFSNIQQGPHTGNAEEFETFEQLWEAVRKQNEYAISMTIRNKDVTRILEQRYLQIPFVSSIDDGCVEVGKDATEYVEIPNPWHNIILNIIAGDSLVAIKKLIFDEKKYTMKELLTALKANWQGYEDMRQEFWNAPKWGNDDDYADEIITKYYDMLADVYNRVTTYSGASPMPLGESVGHYFGVGAKVGATPNGRLHGEAADDGGCSPYMGCDQKGPTAVLMSVSKINSRRFKGMLLNQRLSADLMRSEKGLDTWLDYMDTWYDLDIDHVQFNVASTKELKAAQAEPEKYPDLIVRIAGFSARFVNLSTFVQDTIIARTEQQFAVNL